MPRPRAFSAQTLAVMAALACQPSAWRHGYDLAAETGLKSGTLYPILMRLAERQLVEACWEEGQPAGRPRRHLYRLTGDGLATAKSALAVPAEVPAKDMRPTRRVAAPRRLAEEGS
jgi:PadR family transcriptional regulator, regulatory protein PadR